MTWTDADNPRERAEMKFGGPREVIRTKLLCSQGQARHTEGRGRLLPSWFSIGHVQHDSLTRLSHRLKKGYSQHSDVYE